ncbi:hypothetical protein OIO90_002842 [Microbotryomycetes sp. JL221]|nr:hypothetical protein OIO90_002842 [Microbotryomycetes sp. JL221]
MSAIETKDEASDNVKVAAEATGASTTQPTSTAAAAPVDDNEDGANTPRPVAGWTKTYANMTKRLPDSISSRLPTTEQAQSHVETLTTKVEELSSASKVKYDEWSVASKQKYDEMSLASKDRYTKAKSSYKASKLNPDRMFDKAWSVSNETNVALNVSLNQVGPLHYQVLLPNETFERRVPNLWYSLEVRPWTGSSTAYNSWSVTWPILAVAGPTVAATSLLAIAMMSGGTALTTLKSAGTAAASSVASASSAMTGAGAKAARLAAGAAALPGGARIKNKLVDAARKNVVGENGEVITEKLVRYFAKDPEDATTVKASDEQADKPKREKIKEVDVTGFELEKVLKCDTGKSKVDKELESAFASLCLKEKGIKTADNPVLRIVGGPELEERENEHQVLVFYPFVIEQVVDIGVEPVPPSEVPPTEDESAFLRDARVVPTVKQAEVAAANAPVRGQGEQSSASVGDDKGVLETKDKVDDEDDSKTTASEIDSVVEEAVESVADDDEDVRAQTLHHERQEQEEASKPVAPAKKSWFSWR